MKKTLEENLHYHPTNVMIASITSFNTACYWYFTSIITMFFKFFYALYVSYILYFICAKHVYFELYVLAYATSFLSLIEIIFVLISLFLNFILSEILLDTFVILFVYLSSSLRLFLNFTLSEILLDKFVILFAYLSSSSCHHDRSSCHHTKVLCLLSWMLFLGVNGVTIPWCHYIDDYKSMISFVHNLYDVSLERYILTIWTLSGVIFHFLLFCSSNQ